jgi:hypothetical protein
MTTTQRTDVLTGFVQEFHEKIQGVFKDQNDIFQGV